MDDVEIRPVRDAELAAVAGLRWRWRVEENGRTPAMGRDEFVALFLDWERRHAPSHRCLVALRGDDLIGMGWLAITARVPTPTASTRAGGDVQCVYVRPEDRAGGIGRQLIDALVKLAVELGVERVTVHSSARAVPAYERSGFQHSGQLMQLVVGG